MKTHSYLYIKKIEKNGKLFFKSKKICENVYLKGKVASLLKMIFLVTLNPKEEIRKEMT